MAELTPVEPVSEPEPVDDLWTVVAATLRDHKSVLLRDGEEHAAIGRPSIGCTCGAKDMPADPDDMIAGVAAWRRHQAEAVLSALAAADADAVEEDEILLRSMGPHPDGGFAVELEPSRRLMQNLGANLADLLEKQAGINYVEWQVKPAGQAEPYTLYCIRPGGKTPHQLRQQAEAERDQAMRNADVSDAVSKDLVEKVQGFMEERKRLVADRASAQDGWAQAMGELDAANAALAQAGIQHQTGARGGVRDLHSLFRGALEAGGSAVGSE